MSDVGRYTEVFQQFLASMAETKDYSPEHIGKIITPYCEMMRIAKINRIFSRPQEGKAEKPIEKNVVFLDTGTADDLRCITLVMESSGSTITIKSYIEEGSMDWTTEESNQIRLFMNMLFVFEDRVKNMQSASELIYLDRDTGVGTMRLLFRDVSIQLAKGRIGLYGIARFNLQHFSLVNTLAGYTKGTEVMRAYAQGLNALLGEDGEVVVRMGGDNFMVFFLKEKERKVMEYLTETSIAYGDGPDDFVVLHSQGGVYLTRGNCKTSGDLITRVTIAYNRGIAAGSFIYCDDIMLREDERAKLLGSQFGGALKNEDIHVFYQPQVDIRTGRMESAEALCRWYNNGAYIPSAGFIPLLERDQSVCELDFYMLEHVCRDVEEWRSKGYTNCSVSVNFSARNIRNPEFTSRVRSIIASHGIPPKMITLEISGTMPDIRMDDIKRVVSELKEADIQLALDGFGAGGRTLLLVRDLPWDVVKLDRVMMSGLVPGSAGYSMMKHVLAAILEMNLNCIGQGVESKSDEDILAELGCKYAQGFYYDRPMPKAELERKWLESPL